MKQIGKTGFTLTELLIALAILGIIAAFTIPKLLASREREETRAKLRGAASALESTWYNHKMSGNVLAGQMLYDDLSRDLNLVARGTGLSPAAYITSICSDAVSDGYVVMPDGVLISGLNGGGSSLYNPAQPPLFGGAMNYVLCIDTNGAQAPNRVGEDTFFGNFNQYGDFAAPITPTSGTNKNFNWGSPTDLVYQSDTTGPPLPWQVGGVDIPPEGRVGFWLY